MMCASRDQLPPPSFRCPVQEDPCAYRRWSDSSFAWRQSVMLTSLRVPAGSEGLGGEARGGCFLARQSGEGHGGSASEERVLRAQVDNALLPLYIQEVFPVRGQVNLQ